MVLVVLRAQLLVLRYLLRYRYFQEVRRDFPRKYLVRFGGDLDYLPVVAYLPVLVYVACSVSGEWDSDETGSGEPEQPAKAIVTAAAAIRPPGSLSLLP